ncbi:hypothetical protein B7494_g6406 [Chlorociboria aeruginascens]|nr:hypothetical protein B7494_g6406 [Chlorociboria aeruginascens]
MLISRYHLSKVALLDISRNDGGESVIVKSVEHPRIHNERNILLRFQDRAPLRRLVDEILEPRDPPGIVLQHMDSDILEASRQQTFSRIEIKYVARIVLKALAIFHKDGYVHTDIKPSNVLCNFRPLDTLHGHSDLRFSDVLLADFGSCVPATSDFAKNGDLIGAAMFRSPEANLHLSWGPSTDIWSFGAMLLSLFFGNYHVFNPRIDVEDPSYERMVLERMHMFFGPFPLTYKQLADTETVLYLADIMKNSPQRKPFSMWKDKEFSEDDKIFLAKIMKLDPRDRPTAEQLLGDAWLQDISYSNDSS